MSASKGGDGGSPNADSCEQGGKGVGEMKMSAFWKILLVYFWNCSSRELFMWLNPGDII